MTADAVDKKSVFFGLRPLLSGRGTTSEKIYKFRFLDEKEK
jgi:hypothetical protein